jgi:hypothetical protein
VPDVVFIVLMKFGRSVAEDVEVHALIALGNHWILYPEYMLRKVSVTFVRDIFLAGKEAPLLQTLKNFHVSHVDVVAT